MRLLLALLPLFALAADPKPIRVLVWDEQQPQQSQGYGDKFLGETLAAELAKNKDLQVKTARLADADQGLSDAALDQADVLVFWCHRKVKEQDDARVEAIVKRVQAGKLGFIALHSAHWAKPFVRLMQERAKDDALKQLTAEERAALTRLREWGFTDAFRAIHPTEPCFTFWDFRGGDFHKGRGMRIDLAYVTAPIAERLTFATVDRNARKGEQPSDHAPVIFDLAP
jgi:trehalose utilization protein